MDVKPDIKPKTIAPGAPLTIIVRSQQHGELAFKIKSSAPFYKVANAYCKTKGINPSSVRFHSDGVRLVNDKTIAELELEPEEDEDGLKVYIDAFLEQVGGDGGRCSKY
ncbi:uncharacterized protein H6S33_001226 [Morchella sextelata]|uniref:uncharacterized protein n=1 Tax=Morchella sextelata TaxID=1174677 RepID=UPI001D053A68|nr:uncharacterized protein H6S33_001226 [Morchella sextelata]KAH0608998.1 hypothetical protein H6S33_001226 [Morchella sextelata]